MKLVGTFTTPAETCPYLRDRPYRLKVRVAHEISTWEYEGLLADGVRRFGTAFFEPVCSGCGECIPIRLPVARFALSRAQRRVRRRNSDIRMEIGPPSVDEERLALYRDFHLERHATRGWPRPHIDSLEYVSTFVESPVSTLEFRYRIGSRLAAVAYVDDTPAAFSSVYAFWDPRHAARSLGTFDVLTEIEEARRRGKHYVYLGFHVAGCTSMEYKRAFRPHELRVNGGWTPAP